MERSSAHRPIRRRDARHMIQSSWAPPSNPCTSSETHLLLPHLTSFLSSPASPRLPHFSSPFSPTYLFSSSPFSSSPSPTPAPLPCFLFSYSQSSSFTSSSITLLDLLFIPLLLRPFFPYTSSYHSLIGPTITQGLIVPETLGQMMEVSGWGRRVMVRRRRREVRGVK